MSGQNVLIPLSQVSISNQVIGQGGFGIVEIGTFDNQTVAIKSLSLKNVDVLEAIELFVAEAKKMRDMQHPRIVKFIGFVVEKTAIIMEYLTHGSLEVWIRQGNALYAPQNSDEENTLVERKWSVRYQLLLDVVEGMQYLHATKDPLTHQPKPCLFHQDLKSANVLLSIEQGQLRAKISDFGLSVMKQKGEKSVVEHVGGTRAYMAPELSTSKRFTKACDVYAFGVILFEVGTLLPAGFAAFGQVLPLYDSLHLLSSAYHDLVSRCLDSIPTNRPDFNELIKELQAKKHVLSDGRSLMTTKDMYIIKNQLFVSSTVEHGGSFATDTIGASLSSKPFGYNEQLDSSIRRHDPDVSIKASSTNTYSLVKNVARFSMREPKERKRTLQYCCPNLKQHRLVVGGILLIAMSAVIVFLSVYFSFQRPSSSSSSSSVSFIPFNDTQWELFVQQDAKGILFNSTITTLTAQDNTLLVGTGQGDAYNYDPITETILERIQHPYNAKSPIVDMCYHSQKGYHSIIYKDGNALTGDIFSDNKATGSSPTFARPVLFVSCKFADIYHISARALYLYDVYGPSNPLLAKSTFAAPGNTTFTSRVMGRNRLYAGFSSGQVYILELWSGGGFKSLNQYFDTQTSPVRQLLIRAYHLYAFYDDHVIKFHLQRNSVEAVMPWYPDMQATVATDFSLFAVHKNGNVYQFVEKDTGAPFRRYSIPSVTIQTMVMIGGVGYAGGTHSNGQNNLYRIHLYHHSQGSHPYYNASSLYNLTCYNGPTSLIDCLVPYIVPVQPFKFTSIYQKEGNFFTMYSNGDVRRLDIDSGNIMYHQTTASASAELIDQNYTVSACSFDDVVGLVTLAWQNGGVHSYDGEYYGLRVYTNLNSHNVTPATDIHLDYAYPVIFASTNTSFLMFNPDNLMSMDYAVELVDKINAAQHVAYRYYLGLNNGQFYEFREWTREMVLIKYSQSTAPVVHLQTCGCFICILQQDGTLTYYHNRYNIIRTFVLPQYTSLKITQVVIDYYIYLLTPTTLYQIHPTSLETKAHFHFNCPALSMVSIPGHVLVACREGIYKLSIKTF